MKWIEFKDLRQGQLVIVAFKNYYDDLYYPFTGIVEKWDKLIIKDSEFNESIYDFVSDYKGEDIHGNKLYNLLIFDDLEECQGWCEFENKLIMDDMYEAMLEEYWDNEYLDDDWL